MLRLYPYLMFICVSVVEMVKRKLVAGIIMVSLLHILLYLDSKEALGYGRTKKENIRDY